jgi:hypothetical protein
MPTSTGGGSVPRPGTRAAARAQMKQIGCRAALVITRMEPQAEGSVT